MVKLLDGVEASKSLRAQVAKGVLEMQQKHRVTPGLAAVLVGHDPASAVYIRNKERACAEVGILSEVFRLEQDASEEELLETVARLNADSRYHGILVQLPLPDAIDPLRVAESLDPMKDVDGIHPPTSVVSSEVRRGSCPAPLLVYSNSSSTTATIPQASVWSSAGAAR